MIVTDKDYKRWLNMSYIICNNKEIGNDILQELLLNMIEKNITDDRVNDSYIFMSMKNRYMNYLRNNKKKIQDDNYFNYEINSEDTEHSNWQGGVEGLEDLSSPEDLEILIEKNIKDQRKLDIITETILTLETYEKKLYQLHFIWGYSQRDIAKRIGVSHMTINMRINKIKDKIKTNYEKRR